MRTPRSAATALLAGWLLLVVSALAVVRTGAEEPQAAAKPVLKIGVIGSGISGAASAYWLHELLDKDYDVRLTVWERDDRVGGRIADVQLGSYRMESGGSILHASNRYMRGFASLLNLTLLDPPPKLDSTFGLWDGREFLLRLRGGGGGGGLATLWDMATILWRYGLDFARLEQVVRGVATAFQGIYDVQARRTDGSQRQRQEAAAWFDSPRELLESIGLWDHTQTSFHDWVATQSVWVSGCDRDRDRDRGGSRRESELILHELAVAATRVNYGQDLSVNALVGAVGLIPLTDSKLWSVQGGNKLIVQGLLERAGAQVRLGHSVRRVMRAQSSKSGKLIVEGVKHSVNDSAIAAGDAESPFREEVDVLIVATPLELAEGLEFHLKGGGSSTPQPQPEQRTFQTTHATFISGRLRSAAFAPARPSVAALAALDETLESVLSEDGDFDLPASILTTEEPSLPFTSIAAYSQDVLTGRRVYKVFSREAFGPDRVAEFFTDVDQDLTRRIAWKAYPRYEPPERFAHSFRIQHDPDVWNPTALEPAASCMEMQAIAARNVAMAVAQRWKEKARKGTERSQVEGEHDEL